MSISGPANPFASRQDIIPIPVEADGVPGKVVLRIQFAD
jgi:hypothetical protein